MAFHHHYALYTIANCSSMITRVSFCLFVFLREWSLTKKFLWINSVVWKFPMLVLLDKQSSSRNGHHFSAFSRNQTQHALLHQRDNNFGQMGLVGSWFTGGRRRQGLLGLRDKAKGQLLLPGCTHSFKWKASENHGIWRSGRALSALPSFTNEETEVCDGKGPCQGHRVRQHPIYQRAGTFQSWNCKCGKGRGMDWRDPQTWVQISPLSLSRGSLWGGHLFKPRLPCKTEIKLFPIKAVPWNQRHTICEFTWYSIWLRNMSFHFPWGHRIGHFLANGLHSKSWNYPLSMLHNGSPL